MHFISSAPRYRQSSCRCFGNGMCLLYILLHVWLCMVEGKASHSKKQNWISWLTELADTVLSWAGGENGWMGISLSVLQREGELAIWKSLFYSTI